MSGAIARCAPALVLAGAALFAAGCGGGGDTSERSSGPKLVVAALGDSVTAGAPRWDPHPAERARLRARGAPLDPKNQYEYWLEQRAPGVRVRNCGVSGDVTAGMVRRLARCAKGAKVLIVQGGGNDIVRRRGVARAARNLARIVRRGKHLGLRVELADVVPFGGRLSWRRQVTRLNARIRAIGRREQVAVLPFHNTLEDPANPGLYRPELTYDFIHPSVAGHQQIADLVQLPGRSEDIERQSP